MNIAVVIAAERISATGSARKTAKTPGPSCTSPATGAASIAQSPFPVSIQGRRYSRGISRMIFLLTAISKDTFACPNAIKDCWQAICAPKMIVPDR